MYLGILLLFITQDAVLVSAIIMVCELGTAGFVEIFGPAIGCRLRWFLFSPSGKQGGFQLAVRWIHQKSFDDKVCRKRENEHYRSYLHDGGLGKSEGHIQRVLETPLSPRGGRGRESQSLVVEG